MMRSNFSVWTLLVLMSFLFKNGDASTAVEPIYHFTALDVRLDCPLLEGPLIVWQETNVGEIIAINGTIFSTKAKYSNFDVSSKKSESSLTIHSAEMEDAGIYSCHNPTGKSHSFWLHMQNPPSLSISVNGIVVNTSIYVNENTEVIVECNATGADPPVSVSLAVDDEPLPLDEQIVNNHTHTAYASSRLTVKRSHREIECIDSGPKNSIYERIIYLNVTYPPNCTLNVVDVAAPKKENFSCECVANPEPTEYTFTADGKVIQKSASNMLWLGDKLPNGATNITCWGENGKLGFIIQGIYYDFGNEKDKGLPVGAIVVIAITVAGLLVGLIGLIVSKRRGRGDANGFEPVDLQPM
ncbi:hypothetical protein HOLleu_22023 [Holothuria leucospilota]|uniref:Ig-like domain-containing protein n=1 Tax=Holothuria leucospilota TaxID=206669 RepID=A0A9Q1BX59_HOLLE|nr:hypothetical protein HOLleu_22023 [Holothuria leucospilota]